MDWFYNNTKYSTQRIDLEDFYNSCGNNQRLKKLYPVSKVEYENIVYPVVYHTKWDKCFLFDCIHVGGNTTKISAWIKDIYYPKRTFITQANKLDLVVYAN